MNRRRSNIEKLCDALNELGIKASMVTCQDKASKEEQIGRSAEMARQRAIAEISRISASAKRPK